MKRLRYTIELEGGVKVEMLFTPHLYSFKGLHGITFDAGQRTEREVFEVYADPDTFPHSRGDFHAWMTAEPKAYGKALSFALEALTGKSARELLSGARTGAETAKDGENADEPDEGSKKKARTSWIGRLLRRSSSGRAA